MVSYIQKIHDIIIIALTQHTDTADNENESSVQSDVSNQYNVSTFELEYLLTLFGY